MLRGIGAKLIDRTKHAADVAFQIDLSVGMTLRKRLDKHLLAQLGYADGLNGRDQLREFAQVAQLASARHDLRRTALPRPTHRAALGCLDLPSARRLEKIFLLFLDYGLWRRSQQRLGHLTREQ